MADNSRPPLKHLSSSFKSGDDSDPNLNINDQPILAPTVSFQYTNDQDPEAAYKIHTDSAFKRKRSLVKPERERPDPNHRLFHYRNRAAHLDQSGHGGVKASSTGAYPQQSSSPGVRRGKSVLGRQDPGPGLLRRQTKKYNSIIAPVEAENAPTGKEPTSTSTFGYASIPGPKGPWMLYCFIITCFIPNFLLKLCGINTPERQRAWREKIGLLGVIGCLMALVGFITFGFTQTVCGVPPHRYQVGHIDNGNLVVNGISYSLNTWKHPQVNGWFDSDENSNVLFNGPMPASGMDASFLFQRVNENCKDIITPADNTGIDHSGNDMSWYFPCQLFSPNGTTTPNLSNYTDDTLCHTSSTARDAFDSLGSNEDVTTGQIYFTWDDLRDPNRNLIVYEQDVLDLSLLNWLDSAQVNWPSEFDELKSPTPEDKFKGKDITMTMQRTGRDDIGKCLRDIVRVGFIDTDTVGCVASNVVLYLSLIFIIGVVSIKWAMAVFFGWFLSWRLGVGFKETREERHARMNAIENWSDDIYKPAPNKYRPSAPPNNSKSNPFSKTTAKLLPKSSRFTPAQEKPTFVPELNKRANNFTTSNSKSFLGSSIYSPPDSPNIRGTQSSSSLPFASSKEFVDWNRSSSLASGSSGGCPYPLVQNVVPQPPSDYEPHNFPLAHTICLVTAYSESVEGLRTTLDSLATTDYPNSHKLLLIIADGIVKGSGNDMSTPDICLSMMKDLVLPKDQVEANSFVSIADGHKRHNMAKVFAGFYDYDESTVEQNKQQRVPIILVAKTGNPLEAKEAKPGNRGKRDSQVLLMSFLQKVMFDERMTTFDFDFFNTIWRLTGVCPDRYETCLMVDADTKVFPDSLTRMMACMVVDPEIMGLCGETKIANKAQSWVTMIQVFEYHISHHLAKAFESVFGGVTCLPGCFSMYRIKAPKGGQGYWVPVICNPDIVEHYSENIVDTLHKKNLLLLGEDRFLTTLMLRTLPKRKMMFCPQAVCKTVVPDEFKVLLSQRRRWINSTVHNLFELILVRDLCGTFCFSMQFVVFMEMVGTMVLPAAITFTVYIIVLGIIPSERTPTISLILLLIILGLPGLLIVLTSRRLAYVGWMIIYLFSLPIWNAILPAYSFWHFDDFSWGATRQIEGEGAEESHGDKEGEFDPSHIIMKRWAEFERDRRYRTGTNSRDSTDDVSRSARRHDYRRSVNSNHDGGGLTLDALRNPPSSASRGSLTGPPLIELPQPLSTHLNEASGSTPPPVSRIPENLANFDESSGANSVEQKPMLSLSHIDSPLHDQDSHQRLASIPQSEFYQPQAQSNEKESFLEDNSHLNRPALGITLMDQGPIGESPRRVVKPAHKRRQPSSSLALEQLNQYSQQRRDERVGSSEDIDLDESTRAS
ncbi:hypothetical protein E3P89_00156 [Wallemia ichthyophaga]|nr:hypothetical protein E3P90_00011 [Wallemia ichthyophaga]TIB18519.1 hypothetical protein E3P93_00011 [Wallemia ichthyophaga]TIB26328.1 hypothetical protein E3P89_00156 [Wallemia ichthyophaga]TIB27535.1 hypothetical protein E3P88_00011 [Wallemia ichthyophaga]